MKNPRPTARRISAPQGLWPSLAPVDPRPSVGGRLRLGGSEPKDPDIFTLEGSQGTRTVYELPHLAVGVGRLGGWEVGRLGGWEVGRLGGWEVGRLGGWEVGRLGGWEVGRLGGWEVGRLGGWEVGRLGGWEVGRLGGWEVGRLGGPELSRRPLDGFHWFGWVLFAKRPPELRSGSQGTRSSVGDMGCHV